MLQVKQSKTEINGNLDHASPVSGALRFWKTNSLYKNSGLLPSTRYGRCLELKVGMSTLAFYHEPPEKAVEKAADLGFNLIEVVVDGEYRLKGRSITLLRRLKRNLGLRLLVHAPFSDLNPASLNSAIQKESMKQLGECIESAASLGCEVVSLHPGHFSPYGIRLREKVWDANVRCLSFCADLAEKLDVILGVENMPRMLGVLIQNSKQLLEMVQAVNSKHLKVTLDVGHVATYGVQPLGFLEDVKDYIVNVHLHNNNGVSDIHSSIENGVIKYDDVLNRLVEVGYGGSLIVELYRSSDALQSRRWVENHLPQGKTQ